MDRFNKLSDWQDRMKIYQLRQTECPVLDIKCHAEYNKTNQYLNCGFSWNAVALRASSIDPSRPGPHLPSHQPAFPVGPTACSAASYHTSHTQHASMDGQHAPVSILPSSAPAQQRAVLPPASEARTPVSELASYPRRQNGAHQALPITQAFSTPSMVIVASPVL